ncbi:50S ribosomal protein L5 [Candidatus Woesearchaeota archaeon]|nr:50S ribosomal protein L5 [Candidatus Woesearchaeota archaeon]
MSNSMRSIHIEKLTLNVGAGKSQERLEKAEMLLQNITGIKPVKTYTKKRIPNWGLRPGLPIGCKLTLRSGAAIELAKTLIEAKKGHLKESWFDDEGNIAFGIHEYIDIPTAKYDPKIGIMGLQVCLTLERKGFRVKRRRMKPHFIPKRHRITRDESVEFMKKNFNVSLGEAR